MRADVFLDPASHDAWQAASRLLAVAGDLDLDLRWRAYSLLLADAHVDDLPTYELSLSALRVGERVREEHGDEAAGALYVELARRLHEHGSMLDVDDLDRLLAEADLDPSLAAAAVDPRWDEEVEASMEEVADLVGADEVQLPVVVLDPDGQPQVVADPLDTDALAELT